MQHMSTSQTSILSFMASFFRCCYFAHLHNETEAIEYLILALQFHIFQMSPYQDIKVIQDMYGRHTL